MSFRYQPERFAPDPWPVKEPTELDDDDYALAIRTVPTPRIADIIATLDATPAPTGNIIVYFLFLGRTSSGGSGTEDNIQGYYIRGVVRNKAALHESMRVVLPRTPRADPVRAANQLGLSTFMIPLAEGETRAKVVGWGFAAQ